MSEATTAKSALPSRDGTAPHAPDSISVRHVSMQLGNRYRCASCHAGGKRSEPSYLCHHCGRLFCAECSEPQGWIRRHLFQHQELKSMRGRGQKQGIFEEPWLEAAHCDECLHPVPRLLPWIAVGAGGALLLMVLLWLTEWSPEIIAGVPLLAYVAWVGAGFLWRAYDARYEQRLYFPLNANNPRLELREEFIGEGVLDGHYEERYHEGSPRGVLKVTVPLTSTQQEELDDFARAQRLSEQELETIPASAGSIILEKVQRLRGPDPAWARSGARRWELSAPLPRWQRLWTGEGEDWQTMEFHYGINWQVPRQSFKLALPIQPQAHFPEHSQRRTIELGFMLTGWVATLGPSLRQVTLQRGEGLPPFSLMPGKGRLMSFNSTDTLQVADLSFDADNIARLQLRFDEPPAPGAPAWLSGSLRLTTAAPLSGAEIVAYYNALGVLEPLSQKDVMGVVTVNFRINVGTLPYQSTSLYAADFTLDGAPNEDRYLTILRALGHHTQLVRVHESFFDSGSGTNGKRRTYPARDVMGHWPLTMGDALSPVVFTIGFVPQEGRILVRLQIEAPVNGPEGEMSRAREVWQQLREMIVQADSAPVDGAEGSGSDAPGPPAPPSPPGQTPGGLFSRLKDGQ